MTACTAEKIDRSRNMIVQCIWVSLMTQLSANKFPDTP
jgi:hypothetical protein